jgi:segregation and condensation protein A
VNAYVQARLQFGEVEAAAADGEALIVALGAYEGPLHVLLALARAQKVDLRQISILTLAEQYLAFVRAARSLRFALAAEYLVMAAWLAFLKSKLLLPSPRGSGAEDDPPEDLAARLAFRLARLDAMRRAAELLAGRPRLGRDVFARGDPSVVTVTSRLEIEGDLNALMSAYVAVRVDRRRCDYAPVPMAALRLDDARARLRERLPGLGRWTRLESAAPAPDGGGPSRASCLASTLSAALEFAREGELELRQAGHFEPLYLRAAAPP